MRSAGLTLIVTAAAVLCAPLLSPECHAAPETTSAAAYLPPDLDVFITVRNPAEQVTRVRALLKDIEFTRSDTWQALESNPGFTQARIGILGVAQASRTDFWTGLGALLGNEMAMGIGPGEIGESNFILAALPGDVALTDRILLTVHNMAGLMAEGEPDPSRTRTVEGITVFSIGDDLLQCRVGNALLLSNSETYLRHALENAAAEQGRLVDSERYRRAAARVPDDAVAWAAADAAVLTENAPEGGKLPDPLAGLLFGGLWSTVTSSEEIVSWAVPADLSLALHVEGNRTEPLPATHDGFLSEGDETIEPAASKHLAALTLHRDWDRIFAEREAIFTIPAATEFVTFANTMTALIGGLDFVDGVMASVSGPVRLVAQPQDDADLAYRPTPKLPSFGLIIPLEVEPGSPVHLRINSAFMSVASVINLEQAQQEQPAYLIDIEHYRDQRLVTLTLPAPGPPTSGGGMNGGMKAPPDVPAEEEQLDPGPVDIRYNFAPAAGMVGEHYVLATSHELVHAIVDALLDEEQSTTSEVDHLGIDLRQLLIVLRDNEEELIADRMLEEAQSREEAKRDIDAMLDVLAFFDRVDVTARTARDGASADIVLRLQTTEP